MRVLVTGIFDLLHVEHVRFLANAKNLNHKSEIINKKPSFRVKRGIPGIPRLAPLARDDGYPYLIVGIESDVRVKKLKGAGRPVMGQEDRKEMLEGLKMVDEAFILPDKFDSDDDYLKLLKDVKPDIYAVSENSPYLENKKRLCEKAGVELRVVHGYNPEYSTSNLIEKIASGAP